MQQISSRTFLYLGITLGILIIIIIGILIFIEKKETYKVSATDDPCLGNYCGTQPWIYPTQQGTDCVCSAGWQPTIFTHGIGNCTEIISPTIPNPAYPQFKTLDLCNSKYPPGCNPGYTGNDCNTIQTMSSLYPTNPVPPNISSDLGTPQYLLLLPGPGAEIDFDPDQDIAWGRLYDYDSDINSHKQKCATLASCQYVKNLWQNGRGYVFGTAGIFDLTINVYFRVKNIATGTIYNAHIYYDGSNGTFITGDSGEGRTYGDNITYFNSIQEKDIPTPRGYIPGGYTAPGVIIAGII